MFIARFQAISSPLKCYLQESDSHGKGTISPEQSIHALSYPQQQPFQIMELGEAIQTFRPGPLSLSLSIDQGARAALSPRFVSKSIAFRKDRRSSQH